MLGATFSGSFTTINFELDPKNSSTTLSIISTIGQMSGFLGPLLMAKMTHLDPDISGSDGILWSKWSSVFYSYAGFAAASIVAVVGSYFYRPSEWIPMAARKEQGAGVEGGDTAESTDVGELSGPGGDGGWGVWGGGGWDGRTEGGEEWRLEGQRGGRMGMAGGTLVDPGWVSGSQNDRMRET